VSAEQLLAHASNHSVGLRLYGPWALARRLHKARRLLVLLQLFVMPSAIVWICAHPLPEFLGRACKLEAVDDVLISEASGQVNVGLLSTSVLRAKNFEHGVNVELQDLPTHSHERLQAQVRPLVRLVDIDCLDEEATALITGVVNRAGEVLVPPPLQVLAHVFLLCAIESHEVHPGVVGAELVLEVTNLEPGRVYVNIARRGTHLLLDHQVLQEVLELHFWMWPSGDIAFYSEEVLVLLVDGPSDGDLVVLLRRMDLVELHLDEFLFIPEELVSNVLLGVIVITRRARGRA